MNLFRNKIKKMDFSNRIIYKVENVTKRFESEKGNIDALSNVSFEVKEGETVVVIGPSGCGKTTLLRIFAHLIEPTKGKVIFRDIINSNSGNSEFGFVFQESTLMPWRTVIENIILPLEILGKDKSEMQEKARKLLNLLRLDSFEEYYPNELSGGMSQRVAIARALISDPAVLLMDEPFNALDEILRQKLDFELVNLKKKTNKTIIFVTHSISEAVILADKIIVLGLNPNTVIGSKKINLSERTPRLLINPLFFENVVETRKILEAGLKEYANIK